MTGGGTPISSCKYLKDRYQVGGDRLFSVVHSNGTVGTKVEHGKFLKVCEKELLYLECGRALEEAA